MKVREEKPPLGGSRHATPGHALPHRATPRHATPRLVDLLHGELAELRTPVAETLAEARDLEELQHFAAVQEARDEHYVYDDVPVVEPRARAHHLGAVDVDRGPEHERLIGPQRGQVLRAVVLQPRRHEAAEPGLLFRDNQNRLRCDSQPYTPWRSDGSEVK